MFEVLVASLISGIVVLGALDLMGGAAKTRLASGSNLDGPMLANELLAEVMAKSYEDPEDPGTGELLGVGREAGETTRNTFDDIDDYLNYSESPPLDTTGTPMTEYTDWTRTVSWNYTNRGNTSWSLLPTGLTKIIVTVTAPDGTETQRVGYRSNKGSLEQSVGVDSDVVTWIGAELQIGELGTARAGTNLVNAATD